MRDVTEAQAVCLLSWHKTHHPWANAPDWVGLDGRQIGEMQIFQNLIR
jgi:hypothetical protein